jgi:hypothetical protein
MEGVFMRMLGKLVLVSSVLFLFLAEAQDFGSVFGGPKSVSVKQLLPATVNLNQKRIKIEATAAMAGTAADLPPILKTKLVTMIQRDPRFIVDDKNPETILRFIITNDYIDERRVTTGAGAATQNCQVFTGKLEVSYQAIEASTNAPLDSENLSYAITIEPKKDSGGGALSGVKGVFSRGSNKEPCGTGGKLTSHEAQDELVDQIVHQMGQRAAPTEEPFDAKLPGKKLEPLSSLAISQRWGTLEEQAERMEKLPKPDDDAYRIYLVALAKEAQAYDLAREAAERDQGKRKDISAEDAEKEFQQAQKYLDDARKLYKDAIQAKPSEKEFREPDGRLERAVTVYATIARHKEEYQNYLAQKGTQPTPVAPPQAPPVQAAPPTQVASARSVTAPPKPSDPPPAAQITPLQQILKFCQAGMGLDSIKEYVNDKAFLEDAKATNYQFNIRTDPLALTESCKDKASPLQTLMRARLSPPSATPAPPKPTPAKPSSAGKAQP